MLSGFLWISFSVTLVQAAEYYQVSTFWASLLSSIFLVEFVTLGIPTSYLLDKWGLPISLTVSMLLHGLSAFGRGISLLCYLSSAIDSPLLSFVIMVVAQGIASLAQGFLLNAAGKIAVDYFQPTGQALLTSVGTTANPVGIAAGFFFSSFVVSYSGIEGLIICQVLVTVLAILGSAGALLGCLLIQRHAAHRSHSPSSLSLTSANTPYMVAESPESAQEADEKQPPIPLSLSWSGRFIALLSSFSLLNGAVNGASLLWALLWKNTLTLPQIGVAGAILMLAGLVSPLVAGVTDILPRFLPIRHKVAPSLVAFGLAIMATLSLGGCTFLAVIASPGRTSFLSLDPVSRVVVHGSILTLIVLLVTLLGLASMSIIPLGFTAAILKDGSVERELGSAEEVKEDEDEEENENEEEEALAREGVTSIHDANDREVVLTRAESDEGSSIDLLALRCGMLMGGGQLMGLVMAAIPLFVMNYWHFSWLHANQSVILWVWLDGFAMVGTLLYGMSLRLAMSVSAV